MEYQDSERRRRELLAQTREQYRDGHTPPAIHPRYTGVYHELYPNETEESSGTFTLRVFFCLLLFAGFIMLDYKGADTAMVSSSEIVEAVESQTTSEDLVEVWKNLQN